MLHFPPALSVHLLLTSLRSGSRNQSILSKFMSGLELADMLPQRFVSLTASWMLISSATSWSLPLPFIQEKLPSHGFMQDNDPEHTSRRAQAFLEEQKINWWRTLPESPDLNPIKDLWHELKFFLESVSYPMVILPP